MTDPYHNQQFYPLVFTPVLKDYLWGGRNLEKLGRVLPPGITAESWEIAAHPDGTSTVINGKHTGKLLSDLTLELGVELIGTHNQWALDRGKFPLLIKLLDAENRLSIQVHPDDDYARINEGNELGKTEMWVVLSAREGAKLVYGVKQGTTPENFRAGIEAGDLTPYIHEVPVKAGDHICVPSGTLHAILEGTLIAEIQQNSNTTYRVFDWNRLDSDGRPRPLHIDQAIDVINFDQVEPCVCKPEFISNTDGVHRSRLCANQYFTTERIEMKSGSTYHGHCDGSSLEIWGLLEGTVSIDQLPLTPIQFTLLPAALGEFVVHCDADAILLRSYIQ